MYAAVLRVILVPHIAGVICNPTPNELAGFYSPSAICSLPVCCMAALEPSFLLSTLFFFFTQYSRKPKIQPSAQHGTFLSLGVPSHIAPPIWTSYITPNITPHPPPTRTPIHPHAVQFNPLPQSPLAHARLLLGLWTPSSLPLGQAQPSRGQAFRTDSSLPALLSPKRAEKPRGI